MLFSDPWHKITWNYIFFEKIIIFLPGENFAQENATFFSELFSDFITAFWNFLTKPTGGRFSNEIPKPLLKSENQSRKKKLDFLEQNFYLEEKIISFSKKYDPK